MLTWRVQSVDTNGVCVSLSQVNPAVWPTLALLVSGTNTAHGFQNAVETSLTIWERCAPHLQLLLSTPAVYVISLLFLLVFIAVTFYLRQIIDNIVVQFELFSIQVLSLCIRGV